MKQQREEEQGEGGREVSDSGIRQLVQAAWLEAHLILHLSFHRHLEHKWIAAIKLVLPSWTVALLL